MRLYLMALGTPADARLLQALYTAATDAGRDDWRDVLSQLSEHIKANRAGLIVETDGAPLVISTDQNLEEHLGQSLAENDKSNWTRLRTGRVYGQIDLPAALPLPNSPLRLLRVTWQRTRSAWLFALRHGDDFRAIDSAALSAIALHLPTALELWQRHSRDRISGELAQVQASRFGLGWILFDAQGRVQALDQAAETLIEDTSGLRVAPQGGLISSDPEVERRLSEAFGEVGSSNQSVHLFEGLDLTLTPLPFDEAYSLNHPTAVVLGIIRQAPSTPLQADLVAQLFDIPKSEARLACALAEGASLGEAAEQLGLTIETARNYSKKIYARTGLRSQTDLVRVLLNSSLRT